MDKLHKRDETRMKTSRPHPRRGRGVGGAIQGAKRTLKSACPPGLCEENTTILCETMTTESRTGAAHAPHPGRSKAQLSEDIFYVYIIMHVNPPTRYTLSSVYHRHRFRLRPSALVFLAQELVAFSLLLSSFRRDQKIKAQPTPSNHFSFSSPLAIVTTTTTTITSTTTTTGHRSTRHQKRHAVATPTKMRSFSAQTAGCPPFLLSPLSSSPKTRSTHDMRTHTIFEQISGANVSPVDLLCTS